MHFAKRNARVLSPWLHQKRCNSHCLVTCTPRVLPAQREPIGGGLACAGLPALKTHVFWSPQGHTGDTRNLFQAQTEESLPGFAL